MSESIPNSTQITENLIKFSKHEFLINSEFMPPVLKEYLIPKSRILTPKDYQNIVLGVYYGYTEEMILDHINLGFSLNYTNLVNNLKSQNLGTNFFVGTIPPMRIMREVSYSGNTEILDELEDEVISNRFCSGEFPDYEIGRIPNKYLETLEEELEEVYKDVSPRIEVDFDVYPYSNYKRILNSYYNQGKVQEELIDLKDNKSFINKVTNLVNTLISQRKNEQ